MNKVTKNYCDDATILMTDLKQGQIAEIKSGGIDRYHGGVVQRLYGDKFADVSSGDTFDFLAAECYQVRPLRRGESITLIAE